MRVLVVGSGGREHALAWALGKSRRVTELICAPGNAGTGDLAESVPVKADDIPGLLQLAKSRQVDLTVVGPEASLCGGIADRFRAEGLRIFGPTAAAARIEGDKAYAKQLMKTAHVPTAEALVFHRFTDAKAYVASRDTGVVVKAAGLAGGKGVSVCEDPAYAILALERMMVDREFGPAGETVVVEELLKGEEVSVFALVSGQTIYVLETAQDYKKQGDGDSGANTGGMGAYSPAPIATPEMLTKVEREILVPIVDALRNDDAAYCGLLYAGLMVTAAGPKVLEFNCRFGDPECQVLMMRLQSDLLDLLEATVDGRLEDANVSWDPRPALCVVLASQGYPGKYETGQVIDGLGQGATLPDVCVFHAGTKRVGDMVLSDGGRVLGVTALGADFAEAQRRAYQTVETIHFANRCYRTDIGTRVVRS